MTDEHHIMPSGAAATSTAATRTPVGRFLRFGRYALAAAVILACLGMLAVRFVALPRLDAHRDAIAGLLARELKHPVEIDGIATAWDGWNPEITVRGLRVRDSAGVARQPLIELAQVSGVVSWTSLLVGEVRLRTLRLDRPRMAIRRDVSGRIDVAGIEFDPQQADAAPGFGEWLLKQREIVVTDALLTWNDDLRNAPQLLLDRVNLRLENGFGRHRFGLKGTPPPEIAAPIDVRGDFASLRRGAWQEASGRMYVRLDYADVAAWSEWLPLPVPVQRGEGALRLWFEVHDGVPDALVADVELANVRARLGERLPPLDLAHVAGRVRFDGGSARHAISASELTFVAPDGVRVVPADVAIRYELGPDGETRGGRVAVSHLELAPLSALAAQLPLPDALRAQIDRHEPRGVLTDASYEWEGPLSRPAAFRSRGAFHDVGIRAHGGLPGVARVSGAFEASDRDGSLRVSSRETALELPQAFSQPIVLDTLSGLVRWEVDASGVSVRVDDVEFANADAAGKASGTWSSRPAGPGVVDVSARLSRAEVRRVHAYLPRSISEATRVWVRDSLLAGTAEGIELTLKGDLARFPFPGGRDGRFLLTARGRDVLLDYANGWPVVNGLDGDVRFEGSGMVVTATRGRVLGTAIARAKATMPDLVPEHPLLLLEGEAGGPTAEFLRFVDASPVAAWIDRATDGVATAGNAKLALRLEMHPSDPQDKARVAGELQVVDNQLRVAGLPAFTRVNGKLGFSEREMSARDVAFEAYGGPGRLTLSSRDGTTRVAGSGTANLAALRAEASGLPLDRVSGAAEWRLDLTHRGGATSWSVESNLRGAGVDLPAPIGKAATEAVAFRIERRPVPAEPGRDVLTAQYGDAVRVVAERRGNGRETGIDRALVMLGKAATRSAQPELPGVTLRGDVARLDADAWLAVFDADEQRPGARSARTPQLTAIDLEAGELVVFGRRIEQSKLSARRGAEGWRATIDSRPFAGTVAWTPAGERLASGRVTARFARLDLAAAEAVGARSSAGAQAPAPSGERANPWPELEVVAERYIGRAGDLGRMELSARPEGRDWRIGRLSLVNEAGRIDADGWWRAGGSAPQTKLDVAVDVKDAGAFLARMGLPGDVKAAPTKIEGQLAWPGAPDDFAYPVLSGTLRVNVGAGQFTRLEPGVGRLLGVLSLQALPRRITLDFRDVFSEGFAFDTIQGNVRIGSGIMHTDNLLLSGTAAKVHFSGDVDLERETQALTVRVQPALSTTISAGAGAAAVALLAANPLVGAAVGAGALIAQKVMQDPIEQMFSYEYSVRGSWSEPLVERMARRPLPLASEASSSDKGTR